MSNKPNKQIQQLDFLAKLMDAQFRIPNTGIRFGLDALIGLIPGIGDFSTFIVSAWMVTLMARNGVSGYVLAKMMLNILIDAVIGSIPIIGDAFDVAYKANLKNMRLLKEHYVQGRHKGGAWKVIVPVLIVVLLIIIALTYLSYKLIIAVAHAL